MNDTEKIKNDIIGRFSFLADAVVMQRERRIFIDVDMDNFKSVFLYMMDPLGFSMLCTITGTDTGDRFAILYHLASENGIVVTVKTHIPRDNPEIKSITPYFANADLYERELTDLLGIKISGLAPGNRYPLPEDWPENQHPLRKDWKNELSGNS